MCCLLVFVVAVAVAVKRWLLGVRCLLAVAVRCVLIVLCCSSSVVRCLLVDIRCLRLVVGCLSFAGCVLFVRRLLFAVCCLLCGAR